MADPTCGTPVSHTMAEHGDDEPRAWKCGLPGRDGQVRMRLSDGVPDAGRVQAAEVEWNARAHLKVDVLIRRCSVVGVYQAYISIRKRPPPLPYCCKSGVGVVDPRDHDPDTW